jgi:hypothetical protein
MSLNPGVAEPFAFHVVWRTSTTRSGRSGTRRVVDHDREVVGRDPVTATDHKVVDDAGVLPVQQVVHRAHDLVGAQSQRRRPPRLATPGLTFGVREIPARAGTRALRGMRRLRDIPSAAIAFVQQAATGTPRGTASSVPPTTSAMSSL